MALMLASSRQTDIWIDLDSSDTAYGVEIKSN